MSVEEMWKVIEKGDLEREKAHLPIDGAEGNIIFLYNFRRTYVKIVKLPGTDRGRPNRPWIFLNRH